MKQQKAMLIALIVICL
ncbi:hypothetical protein ECNE037_2165, partial [Escherichia coli NE037]